MEGIKSETGDPDITRSNLQYPDMRRPYSLWKNITVIYMSVTKFAENNDQMDVLSLVFKLCCVYLQMISQKTYAWED